MCEQQISLAERWRQPETQPRLSSVEIALHPSVTAFQGGARPMRDEALNEAPCTTTVFDASGKRRSEIEPLCHVRTIIVPPIRFSAP